MEGDLADIFRATARANSCCSDFNEEEYGLFGDPFPFGSVSDPFLVELDGVGGRAPGSFHGSGDEMLAAATVPFQISTSTSSDLERMSGFAGAIPAACSLQQGVGDHATTATGNGIPTICSPKPSPQLLDAPRVQICSPTTPIAKRRKSQSKKVVCIPAPTTAANSRQGVGEVVPSDLWAWRKYGQKPIKGSPHPRGYYRCSSSKGCLARKQVERSRTDPNMLVITYTSEHNHPWPTQRNSLAGSTRIPSKPSPTPLEPHKPAGSSIKDESDINSSAADGYNSNSSSIGRGADEVAEADGYHNYSKGLNETVVGPDHQELMVLNDIMFDNTYDDNNPLIQYSQLQLDHGFNWDHDLFGDPLNLFFSGARSGFSTADGSKSMLDPFNNCNLFDWSSSTNSNSTTTKTPRGAVWHSP